MADGGRDLWRPSPPAGTPRTGFDDLEGRLHNLVDNLHKNSITLTADVFSDVQRYLFLCSSLCPFSLAFALGTTEKSLTLPSLNLLFRYLYTLIKFFLPPTCFLLFRL